MTIRMSACMSMDGRIALPGKRPDSLERGGWTSGEDKSRFKDQLAWSEAVVVGRITAEEFIPLLKAWKYDRPVYVLTSSVSRLMVRKDSVDAPSLKMVTGQITRSTRLLLCGGAIAYSRAITENLVDEISLTVEPVALFQGPTLTIGAHGLFNLKLRSFSRLNARGTMLLEYVRAEMRADLKTGRIKP